MNKSVFLCSNTLLLIFGIFSTIVPGYTLHLSCFHVNSLLWTSRFCKHICLVKKLIEDAHMFSAYVRHMLVDISKQLYHLKGVKPAHLIASRNISSNSRCSCQKPWHTCSRGKFCYSVTVCKLGWQLVYSWLPSKCCHVFCRETSATVPCCTENGG